jgi:hypothetical protein
MRELSRGCSHRNAERSLRLSAWIRRWGPVPGNLFWCQMRCVRGTRRGIMRELGVQIRKSG